MRPIAGSGESLEGKPDWKPVRCRAGWHQAETASREVSLRYRHRRRSRRGSSNPGSGAGADGFRTDDSGPHLEAVRGEGQDAKPDTALASRNAAESDGRMRSVDRRNRSPEKLTGQFGRLLGASSRPSAAATRSLLACLRAPLPKPARPPSGLMRRRLCAHSQPRNPRAGDVNEP